MPPDRLHPRRPPNRERSNFLCLPRELRDIIYNYAVIEPDRQAKRHTACCPLRQDQDNEPERPPFAVSLNDKFRCRCAKRQCLGLLASCRQIQAEAAPIFWSKNTHCLGDEAAFKGTIEGLRKEYLHCIRSLSMVDFEQNTNWTRSVSADSLKPFKNLENLEIGDKYFLLNDDYETLSKLTSQLPQLKRCSVAFFKEFKIGRTPTSRARIIYIKVVRDMPTRPISHSESSSMCTSRYHLSRDMRRYVTATFSLILPSRGLRIPSYLNDGNNVLPITLRDGTVVNGTIYGLPSGRDARNLEPVSGRTGLEAAGLPSLETIGALMELKGEKELKRLREDIERKHPQGSGLHGKEMKTYFTLTECQVDEDELRACQLAHESEEQRQAKKRKRI